MSKRKGLSLDEKRQRLLDLLVETCAVYRLKDLETKASKEKGIVSQTVKDVLQSLVDDGLVDTDKIGSGNFFWSFPSKATAVRQNKLNALKTQLQELQDQETQICAHKKRALEGREDTEDRTRVLQQLSEAKTEVAALDKQLLQYAASDPEALQEMDEKVQMAKQACDRWTDNVWTLLSMFKDMRPELKEQDILKHFELPSDMDYVQ